MLAIPEPKTLKGRFCMPLAGIYLDGEEFPVAEGDVIRVDSAGNRCIKADAQSPIRYVCIQTKAGSLVQFTQNDGTPAEGKPSWL